MAQVTPALFSTLVWIIWLACSPPLLTALWTAAAVLVVARTTRFGLWWRFGARPATGIERDTMLRAVVALACLRGREQPSVWVANRRGLPVVLVPGRRILVVQADFLASVATARVCDNHVCALTAHALGQLAVRSSAWVAVGEAYCWPAALVAILGAGFSRRTDQVRLLSFVWRVRWLVLGAALVDNFLNKRWPALSAVAVVGTLSWTSGQFLRLWCSTLVALGDERVIAEGLGPTLATMLRSRSSARGDLERISRLIDERDRTSRRVSGDA